LTEDTYGRGQVEWALWRAFTVHSLTASKAMPKVFATRIKKLLELDRNLELSDMEAPPSSDVAFTSSRTDGSEIAYQPIDAFCLAIALDLLDAGYKQLEVVFLMRFLRDDLVDQLTEIHNKPSLVDRQRYRPKDYPRYPVVTVDGVKSPDARVFMIIQKIELKEIVVSSTRTTPKYPTFLEPIFCRGAAALTDAIANLLPNRRRTATIVEIAGTAQAVRAFLAEAPVIHRGRPANN